MAWQESLLLIVNLIAESLQVALLSLLIFEFALELWPVLQQLRHGWQLVAIIHGLLGVVRVGIERVLTLIVDTVSVLHWLLSYKS